MMTAMPFEPILPKQIVAVVVVVLVVYDVYWQQFTLIESQEIRE
jgi:hypothetical protein